MKFNEKLIELRKKQGLSQEELGYKLNVTRQTVSKWELGQTTPEMDKLVGMSKIFNISVDELINESEDENNIEPIIEDQAIGNQNSKNNKVFIIIVIALVAVLIIIGFKIFTAFTALSFFNKTVNSVTSIPDKQQNIVGQMFNTDEQENIFGKMFNMVFKGFDEVNTRRFNGALELYVGSNSGNLVKSLLDKVITNNKTEERKITVKYYDTETQDTTTIKNIKMGLEDFDDFEVSLEYDKEGYVYLVVIEKYENNNGIVKGVLNINNGKIIK